jgi:hypothetical protein
MKEFEYHKVDNRFEANIKLTHRGKQITTKIDTGATDFVLPLSDLKLFNLTETNVKNNRTKTYQSASGEEMKGYQTEVEVYIQGLCIKKLTVYFYEGRRRLFGLRELSKHFKICLNRENFTIQTL